MLRAEITRKSFQTVYGEVDSYWAGKGEDLVLYLPGFSETAKSKINGLAGYLANKRRLGIISNVGHDQSFDPAANFSFNNAVSVLNEVRQQISASKLTIICHSFGAAIGIASAIENPPDQLILDSPLLEKINFSLSLVALKLWANGGFDWARGYFNANGWRRVEKEFETGYKFARQSNLRILRRLFKGGNMLRTVEIPKRFLPDKPTLVIWGEKDRMTLAGYGLAHFDGLHSLEVVTFPKAGHGWDLSRRRTQLEIYEDFVENGKLTRDYSGARIQI